MHRLLEELVEKHPELAVCTAAIEAAYETCLNCFRHTGMILVCGNGGSAADSEHIVGELMKGFSSRRPVPDVTRQKLIKRNPDNGRYLADHLQGALPAISLVSQVSLMTAFANDVAADMAFAQQVYGYGRPGDVLLAISTSGNAANVVHAVQVARAMGLHTVALTGPDGGAAAELSDVAIRVPGERTPDIQERHLPVYHTLCEMLEEAFFGR